MDREIWQRAGGRCEYCQISAERYVTPFQTDHIIAEQHGGPSTPDNLAVACMHCNLHKGPNIAGLDPLSGRSHDSFIRAATYGPNTSPGADQCSTE